MPYAVEFAQSVEDHFRALTARDRRTVLAAINRQLLDEPLKEAPSQNRCGPTQLHRGSYALVSSGFSTRWSSPRAVWSGSSPWDGNGATC